MSIPEGLARHPGTLGRSVGWRPTDAIRLRWPCRIPAATSLPLATAVVAFIVHAPALWNGFVDWDDQVNFLTNQQYRGLSLQHLRWMLTTVLMGQWIPLTWMTLGLDYVVWGMRPLGYHLTNVVLHAANAAVFCLLVRRLLLPAMPRTGAIASWTGAVAATLFFALHPLRAESVAWVTERRDVLSGLFFLLALLAYLIAQQEGQARARRWIALSVIAFALAGLAKAIVVTLPIVLLILDVYPLRRLDAHPRAWLTPPARRLLVEKLPYLVIALFTGVMQVYAQVTNRYLTTLDTLPLGDRITVAFYSVWFYLSTTLVPVGLSPLYELPARVNLLEPRFVVAVLGTLGVVGTIVALRRAWPAGMAVGAAYLVMILPVSGVLHNGHQLAHDRYSYLSCLPWAVLFGGAIAALIAAAGRGTIRGSVARMALGATAVWLAALSFLTWHQVMVWRDNDTLWRYALEADPECAICHSNLGVSLFNRRMYGPAIERFERSIALRPDRVRTQGNLGLALLGAGRPDEAAPRFERVVAKYPADNETRVNMAVSLLQLRRADDAIAHLEQVLERDPRHALALTNLGSALLDRGDAEAALGHLQRAIEVKADLPQARVGLMRTYAAVGQPEAALEQLEVLRALEPGMARHLGPGLLAVW